MLPKKEKFTTKDLGNKNIFKSGKKIFVEYGYFLQTPGGLHRKGIILSKKNFKTAVLRNKYKRLFYNTILEIYKGNSPRSGESVSKEFSEKLKEKSFIFYPKKVFTKEELLNTLKNI